MTSRFVLPGLSLFRNTAARIRLRRKVHAAQQVLEARVGAQVIESRLGLQTYHQRCSLPIAILEPTKSFVFVAQGRVGCAHQIRRYVSLLREFLQLLQDLFGLIPISRRRIRLSEASDEKRSSVRKLHALSHCGDCELPAVPFQ